MKKKVKLLICALHRMQVLQTTQNVPLHNDQASGMCSTGYSEWNILITVFRFDSVTKLCTTGANQHSCNLIEFLCVQASGCGVLVLQNCGAGNMPNICKYEEYVKMHFVYGSCNRSCAAAAVEYR
jgi:hypothetical protein